MIKIITPTGDRPEAFALCKKYVSSQTLKPDMWIIIDDGHTLVDLSGINVPYKCVRREPTLNDPDHTLKLNILTALDYINKNDHIFVIEDDDWYSHLYIDYMMCNFNHDLIGLAKPHVYSLLKNKYYRSTHDSVTSFSRCAFKGSVIPILKNICREPGYLIDSALWKGVKDKKLVETEQILQVSVKNMPGRLGTTVDHKENCKYFVEDGDFILSIIGEEYVKYVRCLSKPVL